MTRAHRRNLVMICPRRHNVRHAPLGPATACRTAIRAGFRAASNAGCGAIPKSATTKSPSAALSRPRRHAHRQPSSTADRTHQRAITRWPDLESNPVSSAPDTIRHCPLIENCSVMVIKLSADGLKICPFVATKGI